MTFFLKIRLNFQILKSQSTKYFLSFVSYLAVNVVENAQPSGPAPNNTKDICSICKEIIPLFAPEDGRVGPKHVELNK